MITRNKKNIFSALLVGLTFLGMCSLAQAIAPATIEITVHLEDCIGDPIAYEDITIQPAYGGSWGAKYDVTTDDCGDACVWVGDTYTKIRVTLNQGSEQQMKTVDDCYTFTAALLTIQLQDHNGDPITDEGGKVDQGGGYWDHHGYTDSSGEISVYVFPDHNYKFRVTYNYTSLTQYFVPTCDDDNLFVFQTELAVVSLSKNCSDTPIDGAAVTYAAGSWRAFGTTGDDGPGLVSKELFPGTYKIRLTYNYITNQIMHDLTTDFDFKTVEVTLFGISSAQYAGGSWRTFTLPTMDLLPGTYKFRLDGVTTYITVSADNCSQVAGYLTLLDSSDNGVPGGKAQPACGGTWQAVLPGETDSNGMLWAEPPVCFTKIGMTINQSSQQQLLAELEASNYTWYTDPLVIELRDDQGALLTGASAYYSTGGGLVEQGGGTWVTHGYTDDALPLGQYTLQVFGGQSFRIRMGWENRTQQIDQVIPVGGGTITFQTGKVILQTAKTLNLSGWKSLPAGTYQFLPGTITIQGGGSIIVTAGATVIVP
jgi:hypothetical protein